MEYFKFDEDNAILRFPREGHRPNFFYHINNFPFKTKHSHKDYWEFTIVTNGCLKNVMENKEDICPSGTLFYASPNDAHYISEIDDENKEMRYINIIVREETVNLMSKALSNDFYNYLINNNKPIYISERFIYDIEKIIHQTTLLERSDDHSFNDLLCSAFMLILQKILYSRIYTKSEHKFVNQITNIFNKPESLKLNVNELAEKTGYSRMQLDRLMKEHFQQTPHEFLSNYRLKYAENLLLATDLTINEICSIIGYNDMPVFCNNFKRVFGTTPLKYRNKLHNK